MSEQTDLIPAFAFNLPPGATQEEVDARYRELIAKLPEALHADLRLAYSQLRDPATRTRSHLRAVPGPDGLKAIARWSEASVSTPRLQIDALTTLIAEALDEE
jgi:hypothetical protein